ncbi:MAG: hypothetical protein ABIH19_04605 [Candidatus Omnitrophota bacterium]
MKRETVVLVVVVLIVLFYRASVSAQELVWQDIGRGSTDFRTVFTDTNNQGVIYAGTGNSIIKTEDAGDSWRNILSIKGENGVVNLILAEQKNMNSLYAATGNGLYYSCDIGRNWRRIFQGKNGLEKDCRSLAVLPAAIYLGTKGGLFVSKDKGRSWQRQVGELGNIEVLTIAYNEKEPGYVYIACVNGVFRTKDSGQIWERIFTAHAGENSDEQQENSDDTNEGEEFSNIRHISIDYGNLNNLYLSTSRGIFQSQDKGQTWELVSSYGLLSSDVSYLLISPLSSVYAVTRSGIFLYRNGRWFEQSIQLVNERINSISIDKENNIYAACNNGLFRANLNYSEGGNQNILTENHYKDEPGIAEVQTAAIQYAEVEPEKIRKWRRQAARKAWLPEVTLSADRNVTDLWHWEGGSTTRTDDDFLRKGHDALEWGIDLSWDLGELIWNDDQTSIDVRSRLVVQLRDDILDEVTKIYFERLRVINEIDSLSITEKKRRFEKGLRLRELTAYLDGLTGGYFSDYITKRKEGL